MKNRYLAVWLLCCAMPAAAAEKQADGCADPCLKAAIAALYIHSPFLSPFRVDIRVQDAEVILEGRVSDAGERALAEEIAAGVEGITAVDNRIQIDPSMSAARTMEAPVDCLAGDEALADRVKAQLYWHRPTHGMDVGVSARDGTVTLRGEATDPRQAELARLIALNTCGVKRVDSRLSTATQP
ncbi:MAG: BON domain-containing protein [Gammaproteobacteria bacterium]|jgi:osmotically-inducible protein OsmY